MINIIANGSKWAGEAPDTIETLLKVLTEHKLDIGSFGTFGFVSFESDNGYSSQQYEEHNVKISGNFSDISHVFQIEGVYKELENVIKAIEDNLKRQQKD